MNQPAHNALSETLSLTPTMKTTPPTADRIEWLDAARGIACVLVLVLHFYHTVLVGIAPYWLGKSISGEGTLADTLSLIANRIPQNDYLNFVPFILGFWDIGKMGVLVFFLISGFVIPMSLLRPRKRPLVTFALSRFFRLYPVYWLSVFLMCIVWTVFPVEGIHWGWGQLLVNITMFQKFVGVADINGVAWTLQIELIFYAMCAGLFALKLIRNTKAIVGLWGGLLFMGLAFAAFKFFTGKYIPVALPMGLCYMVLGYLSRSVLLKNEEPLVTPTTFWGLVAITIGVAGLASYWGYTDDFFRYLATYTLAILMYFMAQKVLVKPAPFLKTLGKISYSVYLFHPAVGGAILYPLVVLLAPSIASSPLILFSFIAVGILITIGFSYLTYKYIEEPAIAMGRNYIAKANQ
jgi:peptidoglycan/LPS O-acetylase OafA/YrhL